MKNYFDKIFDAYFGLRYSNVDLDCEADVHEEDQTVKFEDIDEGNILQHSSGTKFRIVLIEELCDGLGGFLITVQLLLKKTYISVNEEYIENCFLIS